MGRQVFFFQVSVLIARQQNEASSWLHSSWPQITLFTPHVLVTTQKEDAFPHLLSLPSSQGLL